MIYNTAGLGTFARKDISTINNIPAVRSEKRRKQNRLGRKVRKWKKGTLACKHRDYQSHEYPAFVISTFRCVLLDREPRLSASPIYDRWSSAKSPSRNPSRRAQRNSTMRSFQTLSSNRNSSNLFFSNTLYFIRNHGFVHWNHGGP